MIRALILVCILRVVWNLARNWAATNGVELQSSVNQVRVMTLNAIRRVLGSWRLRDMQLVFRRMRTHHEIILFAGTEIVSQAHPKPLLLVLYLAF